MVRSLTVLWISIKTNVDSKYIPKNIERPKMYPVVCEKTVKYKNKDDKESEELSFGIINETNELCYIASYNCKVFLKFGEVPEDRIIWKNILETHTVF